MDAESIVDEGIETALNEPLVPIKQRVHTESNNLVWRVTLSILKFQMVPALIIKKLVVEFNQADR